MRRRAAAAMAAGTVSRVWYFAYGSNMQTATFHGRRGIAPTRALPARASGWRLVLDKPPLLPIGESFANIVPEPGAEVLGVLYEIAAADLAQIDLTEGVLIGNYRRIEIPTAPLATDAPEVTAFTLVSERRAPDSRPSQRYMSFLVAGAEEHGLPAEWIAFLRGVPACEGTARGALARRLVAGLARLRRG